jgi:large subunit ribosomal protein L9
MKVILQQDLKGTGKSGDIVNVSEGYARNFLLPKGLAIPADSKNMDAYNQKKKAEKHQQELEKAEALKLSEGINGITLTITAKTGTSGKLFGSVTSKEIADALAGKGFSIDKRKIDLPEPIRTLSSQQVEIKIYPGITSKINVEVVSL